MAEESVNIMPADDAVAGWAGVVYVTYLDTNKRFVFARVKKVDAKVKFNNSKLSILGSRMKKHKQGTGEGTGSATMYYCDSMMRKKAEEYKDKGKLFRFDMEVYNEDVGSNKTMQATTLKDCLIDELVLAKIDADSEYIEEDISFTFDDFSVDETFEDK